MGYKKQQSPGKWKTKKRRNKHKVSLQISPVETNPSFGNWNRFVQPNEINYCFDKCITHIAQSEVCLNRFGNIVWPRQSKKLRKLAVSLSIFAVISFECRFESPYELGFEINHFLRSIYANVVSSTVLRPALRNPGNSVHQKSLTKTRTVKFLECSKFFRSLAPIKRGS